VNLARVAWLVTVGALLVTVIILVAQGYYGYAAVTFSVALAAGVILLGSVAGGAGGSARRAPRSGFARAGAGGCHCAPAPRLGFARAGAGGWDCTQAPRLGFARAGAKGWDCAPAPGLGIFQGIYGGLSPNP
jgi:hypothetical protein